MPPLANSPTSPCLFHVSLAMQCVPRPIFCQTLLHVCPNARPTGLTTGSALVGQQRHHTEQQLLGQAGQEEAVKRLEMQGRKQAGPEDNAEGRYGTLRAWRPVGSSASQCQSTPAAGRPAPATVLVVAGSAACLACPTRLQQLLPALPKGAAKAVAHVQLGVQLVAVELQQRPELRAGRGGRGACSD